MKNINYKLLLVASTLLLLPQLVQAQNVESCNPTDCKTLGYSRNSTNYCAKYLACPFDGSYKICLNQCSDKYIAAAEKISPIVAEKSTPKKTSAEIAANTQLSLTGNLGFSTQGVTELIALLQTEFGQEAPNPSDIKTVDDLIVTFGSDCADYPLTSCPSGATCESQYIITSCQSGYKLVTTILGTKCTKTTTETTCSAGQYNNNGTCTACPAGTYNATSGSATSCTKCASGSYQDQTGQTSCKTCATATTTGATSCTITCDEAIQKAGGIKLTTQTTIEYGSRNKYYLTKDIDLGDVDEIYEVSFYAASSLPECANDSSVMKSPTLQMGTVGNMYGMLDFNVNTKISRAIFGIDTEFPEFFVSNTLKIYELVMDNSNEDTSFTLECVDLQDPNVSGVQADIGYTCEYGGNQQCNMTIQCQDNDSIKLTEKGLQTNIWCHGSMVNKYESNDCGISWY